MNPLPTIGLEIHAELKTKTKMFCGSANDPEEKEPNKNICPVCLGYPGTLPVINREAVRRVLLVGKALGGRLADFSEFDRKNYFYPDIPKGYQISQYKYPLVSGGKLNGVEITRVHLEEDTARSMHDHGGAGGDYSLVDFNRAGVPLMELVTEPVIHSAKEAANFARELQLLLRTLGASDANMEKGEMRVEANISVSSEKGKLGTKVEVKNLNSFRTVEKAIEYEIARHTAALQSGEKIVQETRGWDEAKQKTFSQRSKENAHDYRYFPDPDLPKLKLSEVPEFRPENIALPELPEEKRARYKKDFGIKDEDSEMYVSDFSPFSLGDFFERVTKIFPEVVPQGKLEKTEKLKEYAVLASNYISSDLAGLVKNHPEISPESAYKNLSPENFAALILLLAEGKISSRGAKDILAEMFLHADAGAPEKIAEEKNLLQKSDESEMHEIAKKILAENPQAVEEYRSGKIASLQFLVGQGMKATKGSANPEVLKKALVEELKITEDIQVEKN